MAKIEFNINNYVEFELTEAGVERLYELDEKFNGYKWFTPKEYVVGQKMRMQLWSVMEKFGSVSGAGHLTFCKDCVITFDTKENE